MKITSFRKIGYCLIAVSVLLISCSAGVVTAEAAVHNSTAVYQWLTFLLPPLTGVVTWFASRHTRQVSTIESMQHSIDMLVQKNEELYSEIIQVRAENETLKTGQHRISAENEGLRKQLDDLLTENKELKSSIAELKKQLKTNK